jgi:hypothetical protein
MIVVGQDRPTRELPEERALGKCRPKEAGRFKVLIKSLLGKWGYIFLHTENMVAGLFIICGSD